MIRHALTLQFYGKGNIFLSLPDVAARFMVLKAPQADMSG